MSGNNTKDFKEGPLLQLTTWKNCRQNYPKKRSKNKLVMSQISMTPLSPELNRIPVKLHGDWIRRWERNIWEGTISCDEPFVTLLIVRLETELFWGKSLPSKDNRAQLQLDLMPTSRTEPLFQLHFLAPSGGFVQGITTTLPERDYRPVISAPTVFETGFIVPFATFNPSLEFSFACFAKTDVAVRRLYVWGLKSRFLEDIDGPWREILTRGRHGKTPHPVTG